MDLTPLLVALAVVVIAALVWGGFHLFGIPIHPRLEQVGIALIVLIVIACVLVWVLRMAGWAIPAKV